MDFKIFKNKITLKFNNNVMETDYSKSCLQKLTNRNFFITLAFFFISLLTNILIIYNYNSYLTKLPYIKNLSLSCSISFFYLIFLIFLKWTRYSLIQYLTNYFNFANIFFLFSFFRFYLELIDNKEQILGFILLILDFIFKLFLLAQGNFGVIEIFLLLIFNSFSIIAYYLPSVTWDDLRSYFIGYNCLLILFLLVTYCYVYHSKKTFYFTTKLKNKMNWCKNIIDNMSSGFVFIKNGKIKYINKMLKERINFGKKNILEFLLADIYSEDFDLESFKAEYLRQGEMGEFCFAGVKRIENEAFFDSKILTTSLVEEFYFEIFFRYNFNKDTCEDDFEFIFNDITRTKLNEKKNAEFKFKTLYLAKVAHEFKNPLICINELSEQLIEKNPDKITHSIKSLSNYLLILIKDLDYFSEQQAGEERGLNITEVNIDELIAFCSEIAKGLLKKAQKELDIEICIQKDEKICSTILSDEIKLKQVIVNLLSNSIKFTTRGKITIEVLLVNEKLRFMVSDTGKGISNTQDLFKPFKRGLGSDNKLGTGLGLSIVFDLIQKLGDEIKYNSTLGEGSSFWFDIPYNYNKTSLSAYPDRTYSDQIIKRKHSTRGRRRIIQSSLNINRYKTHISPESKKSMISNYSNETIELKNINFNTNLINKYYNVNEYHFHCGNNNNNNNNNFNDTLNEYDFSDITIKRILIVDDDYLVRKSTIRNLKSISDDYIILQAEDGLEALYQIYKNLKNGIFISCIISDESMNYMNGSLLSEIVNKIKNLPKINFCLLTGFNDIIKTDNIDFIYRKPLSVNNAKEIFKLI
jgi:signal transduction histidine kinase